MIRPAAPGDVDRVVELIDELAGYERLGDESNPLPTALREHLFGPQPACQALVATSDATAPVVGYALFYRTYSTFKTATCLHLEDLYVTPDARGQGHGRALLAAVAAVAQREGCPRLDWNVLDWNRPAIGFYRDLGADVLPDWRTCRLDGDALQRVADLADRIS